jgi:hypothetical protein
LLVGRTNPATKPSTNSREKKKKLSQDFMRHGIKSNLGFSTLHPTVGK